MNRRFDDVQVWNRPYLGAMRIDLNADLGESSERWASGEDVALLGVVTSANVCCGAYAGDDELITATCAACVEREVAIGAQVGYPDREGFGRVPMDLASDALREEVARQIAHLVDLAKAVDGQVTYVKPHGALYNTIVRDDVQAAAVVEAVRDAGLPIVGLPGAASLRLAKAAGVASGARGLCRSRLHRRRDAHPAVRAGRLAPRPA